MKVLTGVTKAVLRRIEETAKKAGVEILDIRVSPRNPHPKVFCKGRARTGMIVFATTPSDNRGDMNNVSYMRRLHNPE